MTRTQVARPDPFAGLMAAGFAADGGLAAMRQRAAIAYRAAGLPTRRDESWKYTDLKRFNDIAFRRAGPEEVARPVDRLPRLLLESRTAARLVFVNGGFRRDLSSFDGPPDGVTVRPLAAALAADAADVVAVLGDGEALSLVTLNTALFEDGTLIDVAPMTPGEAWLELVFIGGGGPAIASALRHVVRVGAGTRLGIVEHHIADGGDACFANGVMQVIIDNAATLRHYRVIDGTGGLASVVTTLADLDRDAAYESFAVTLGGAFSRVETNVRLNAPGATCRIGGAYAIDGREFCDNTTNVWHRSQKTTSRQVYKGVIDGAAHAVYQGRIVVEPGAQETDGHQLSKALLLSDEAEIDQKPALEIFADNVKCSHGAAAGQIDATALFYLRSRGLPETVARQMLLEGFLADVLLEVSDDAVRQALQDRIITAVRRLGKDER